jgi:RimJ/RimL family protein N-acetyltransferase
LEGIGEDYIRGESCFWQNQPEVGHPWLRIGLRNEPDAEWAPEITRLAGKKRGPSDDALERMKTVILETSRLILREFTWQDVDALARVLSDPEAMRFYPAPLDRVGVEQWIARNMRRYEENGHGLWAMLLKSSGELIGDCGLTVQNVDHVEEIEIGYHVRRDLWGQGLAPEAARGCRDYGFAKLSAERLISLIRPENIPSRRVAEKNGMTVWKEIVWRGLPHLVYAIERDAIRLKR